MTDRTVLVTGAGSQIGIATALTFRDEGWTVVAGGRPEDDMSELSAAGCHTDTIDLADRAASRRIVNHTIARSDRLDCVVSIPPAGSFGPVEDIAATTSRRYFEETALGFHRLARQSLPHMREVGSGTFITIPGVLGRLAAPGTGAVSGARAALEAYCVALRDEVAAHGIDVVIIEPAKIGFTADDRSIPTGSETAYEWVWDLVADTAVIGADASLAASPEAVGVAVYDAAAARNPAPRYTVGRLARLLLMTRFIPAGWRSVVYRLLRKVA